MDLLAAGRPELDDWIQIIVVLLVIGGSVLGAISKKLIEAFSPKDSNQSGGKSRGAARGRARTTPSARGVQPVAYPMPPIARAAPAARPPTIRVYAPGPMVEGANVMKTPPPIVALPSQQGPPAPPTGRVEPSQQRPTTPKPVVTPPPRRHEPGSENAGAYGGLEYVESGVDLAVEEPGETEKDGVRRVARAPEAPTDVLDGLPLIGRPTVQTLRQAILMREILGPPVCMRAPDEPL